MSAQEELQEESQDVQTEQEQETETTITADYSGQLYSIESTLNRIEERLEIIGSESYFESNGIALIEGKVNLADILTALIFVIISLGLIFGAVVFRHFRK